MSKRSAYAEVLQELIEQRAATRKQLAKLDRRIEYYIEKMKQEACCEAGQSAK